MVGGDFLWCLPMPGRRAIAVVDSLNVIATADGLFVVGCGDEKVVGGLVGEVIDTREPSLAKVMRLAIKAHAEVVDVVSTPPFDAAPAFAKGRALVGDV